MRYIFALSVSLLFCVVFYVVILKNIHRTWSPQQVHNPILKLEFFWRNGLETTEGVFSPSQNLSARKTAESTVKEAFRSLHNAESQLELALGSHKLTASTTALPVLLKRQFEKIPKWDFEDVYVQSGNERRSVCAKSLLKSKDKEFQAAVIPNIQLWLHNGHLNLSEWNRLMHFNNPFGFMEYKYEDIKSSVDLIPEPKYTHLLPVPESAQDGCIRCAVVATGGILSGSKMGKEIDSHHYVFRMNGAVIKGYEEDVGNKTSVYVHTSFSLFQSIHILKHYGFNSIPKDKGIKYVLIPEGLRDFEWIQGLFEKNTVKKGSFKGVRPYIFYGEQFDKDTFYVLHPDFLRYVRNRFLRSANLEKDYWHLYRPTNGAFTLFLALHTCDIVNGYGFITADHHKYSNYYFERATKTKVIFYLNHDYNLEIQTWKKLHDSGIIRLYQRKQNLNESMD